ncbi:MAG: aldo/keto reductase, partial [Actinomycetota bacterium]
MTPDPPPTHAQSRRVRTLPGSGRVVPPIAYGCWRFAGATVDEARARIEAALDAGLTLVDTADIYGFGGPGFGAAEELLGAV